MKFSEEQLKYFAKPLSKTEEKQCENAIYMIIKALEGIGFFSREGVKRTYEKTPSFQVVMRNDILNYDVKIFLQGSYANNTNVRTHSDVDIAVVQEDTFITKYRYGVKDTNYGFSKAAPKSISFKDLVENALKLKFGSDVVRKNKSIKINGNSYRNDADSVPAMRYRDYTNDYSNDGNNYIGGILIKADDGSEVINYPELHIKNGIHKNNQTNYYYKKMVRIAKALRYEMIEMDENCISSKASSFGVESLIWNVPNELFKKHPTYKCTFEEIVNYLYVHRNNIASFKEANGVKGICDDNPFNEFIYEKFICDLKGFYEYEN